MRITIFLGFVLTAVVFTGCELFVPDLKKAADSDSETATHTGSDTETDTGFDSGSDTRTDTGSDSTADTGSDSDSDTASLPERERCVAGGGYWYDENDVFAETIEAFDALTPSCHGTATENCATQTVLRWAYLTDDTFLTSTPSETELWNVDAETGDAPPVAATRVLSTVRCFTNLSVIAMPHNRVTEVDLSNNTRLALVNFYDNWVLADIYLPRMSEVTELHLSSNKISHIDLSDAQSLRVLYLAYNSLMEINLKTLLRLTEVDIEDNFIDSEINVSQSNNLTYIDLSGNPVETLVLPRNPAHLQRIYATATQLSAIDLTGCSQLSELQVDDTRIQTLDVSAAGTSLDSLSAYNTRITALNLAQNPQLTSLILSGCNILSLVFPENSQLSYLELYNSNLRFNNPNAVIDFTSLTRLQEIVLSENEFIALSDVAPYIPPEFWQNPLGILDIEESKWLDWEARPTDWDYNSADEYAYHR
jgi:hypothetical protein